MLAMPQVLHELKKFGFACANKNNKITAQFLTQFPSFNLILCWDIAQGSMKSDEQ